MANKKISDFTTISNVGGPDLLLIDQAGTTYNTTVGALTSNLGGNFIAKPSSATGGQVLTYNGSTSTWVASAAPTGGTTNNYTIVGNASAGIFASAVCYIPSDPGTGTWTAPAGCYTARVTIVGGGGNPLYSSGGRSHFNYPSGSTTTSNQMFANGGSSTGSGGSAGWNGINTLAIGGDSGFEGDASDGGFGGGGGSGGGGYGGGGGGGGGLGGGGGYGNGGSGAEYGGAGGGSGGVGGRGGRGSIAHGTNGEFSSIGGYGGGTPTLSYAATLLSNFSQAITQNPGSGGSAGGGGGWCSAIVSVTPGQSYSYAVGADGGVGASYGMVVIEW
jgi:hypothetical protein